MCTGIALTQNGTFYFGRNLDLDCSFGEEIAVAGTHYPWTFTDGLPPAHPTALVRMARVVGNVPLYAAAVPVGGSIDPQHSPSFA